MKRKTNLMMNKMNKINQLSDKKNSWSKRYDLKKNKNNTNTKLYLKN